MFPLSEEGPYFATILAPGVIDTKGGPATNAHGQVLDHSSQPIPRLYAVGNCAASPTAQGSWAAGGTLGPMVTFAWLAGQHAATGVTPVPLA
jgi:predicted oxidoreductase